MQSIGFRFLSALLCVAGILLLRPAVAAPRGDYEARQVHNKLYRKAEAHITGGSAGQQLRAAMFLGARRNPRYVRIIGRRLLNELDAKSPYLVLPRNDPSVKSAMAWALGHIGHEKGTQYLLAALPKVEGIIAAQTKRIKAAQKKELERYKKAVAGKRKNVPINDAPLMRIILNQDVPGPYQKNRKHALPYSPDVYWSISDEFKTYMAPDSRDSGQRLRLMGFNWINLAFRIFDALGEIYVDHIRKDTINASVPLAVSLYLDQKHPPFIRGAAAVCLGKIGSPKAMEQLQKAYLNEKDYEVRARLAYAILRNDRARTKVYLDMLKYLEDDRRHVRFVAVMALRELKMGESLVPLQSALRVENVPIIRELLKQAIEYARVDNLKVPG